MKANVRSPHIAILAGEASGDLLGAPLIEALRKRYPQATFSGVGGEHMQKAGLQTLADMSILSVMGLAEVLSHLPAIFKLKRQLLAYWQDNPPDIFIGIDAPDFNLRIEAALRARGIPTVHYVSPSLWAWKEKRIKKVIQSVDLMLCLFPFEMDIYHKNKVKAVCVGHPMKDRLKPVEKSSAQQQLNIENGTDSPILGLFPGSRSSEIERLLPIFLRAMMLMQVREPKLRALISVTTPRHRKRIEEILHDICPPREQIMLSEASSETLISAADVLMLASGTITLEAALLARPMLVAYRVHPLTAKIARFLLKIRRFSLPNLLAKRDIVNEWIQDDCTPENLADDAITLLHNETQREQQLQAFAEIASALPNQVSERAAEAIEELLGRVLNLNPETVDAKNY